MKLHIGLVLLALLCLHCRNAIGRDSAFAVSLRRSDDVCEITGNDDKTVFAIKSPFGISRAEIERRQDHWPKSVVIRLHLKGLENFQAESGTVTLGAAVTSGTGEPKVRGWKDGDETSLVDETSPYWIKVDAVPKEGYFDLTLPPALFEGNPKSIKVSWIDFYR